MRYVNLRAMAPIEYPLLANFLYEAIFVPPGAQAPARSVLQQPQLQVYTANFGTQKGDFAFVAEQEGQIIGAAWCRLMKDYGHYREDVPSMAIAMLSPYRGAGNRRKTVAGLAAEGAGGWLSGPFSFGAKSQSGCPSISESRVSYSGPARSGADNAVYVAEARSK